MKRNDEAVLDELERSVYDKLFPGQFDSALKQGIDLKGMIKIADKALF